MKKKVLCLLMALSMSVGLATSALAVDVLYGAGDFAEGEETLEIANVVAEETYCFPDDDEVEHMVFYVEAPATITVLADIEAGQIGYSVQVVTIDDEGMFEFAEEPEMVEIAIGEMQDDIIPEGAAYVLEEGAYYFDADDIADTFFVIVVAAETEEPGTEPDPTESTEPSFWAVEYVEAATELGLVPEELLSGFTTPITRAEFCALAVRLYETIIGEEIEDRLTFEDTEDENVEKAAAIGVVNGIGNDMFAPDTGLTREQAATMLSRLAAAIGYELEAAEATFDDMDIVSDWAVDAVGEMQESGVMDGVGNNMFSPKASYTREQSIITVLRLFNIIIAE